MKVFSLNLDKSKLILWLFFQQWRQLAFLKTSRSSWEPAGDFLQSQDLVLVFVFMNTYSQCKIKSISTQQTDEKSLRYKTLKKMTHSYVSLDKKLISQICDNDFPNNNNNGCTREKLLVYLTSSCLKAATGKTETPDRWAGHFKGTPDLDEVTLLQQWPQAWGGQKRKQCHKVPKNLNLLSCPYHVCM